MSEPLALSPALKADTFVKDVDAKSFIKDVLEASRERLVLVDFWAPWCGPCKQLAPLLEKLVAAHKGAVLLAKINIDENPDIAQQMRVQSVPTVFAFFKGQPVDGFAGAQSESQLKLWMEKLVKATGARAEGEEDYKAALGQAAEFLASGDAVTARAIYADIYGEAPDNFEALGGLLRCMIGQGEISQAQEILDSLEPDALKNNALEGAKTALELALQASKAGDVSALQARLEENENDHQTRFDLALAHYAAGAREAAVEELLEIVRRERAWQDEAARKQLVKFFEAFGPLDPLTVSARKRLSSLLFS